MTNWKFKGEEVTEMPAGKVGFLYLIITPENRFYIGQCTSVFWRNYWGGGRELKEYYSKYSKKGVRRIIIQFFNCELELDRAEIHLCQKVNASANPKYYNRADGGKMNVNVSTSTKVKISKARTGIKLSNSTKAKLRKINTGKKHSKATKAKISAISKGHTLSAAAKAKISKKNTGKKRTLAAKQKMRKVHWNNKEVTVKGITYQSAAEASRQLGITTHFVKKLIKGETK